jgi:2-alkenal reductase
MNIIVLRLRNIWLVLVPLLVMGCSALSLPPVLSGSSIPDDAVQISDASQKLPTQMETPDQILNEQDILVNLYKRLNPSVVNITIFGKQGDQVIPLGQGSGFFYDSNGNIITNAHVINGADQVEVTFSDGSIRSAQIIGQDPHSDLAVVKVESLAEELVPLPLSEMDTLAVGQSVVAIGNPFGLEGTLTQGIISALGRTIPALTPFSIPQSIQTDAAINPGNSGGPLLNLEGEVIGVNAQIETDGTSRSNSGVGFAIPVSVVKRVIPALIQEGKYGWSWLGVQGGDLTPVLAEAMALTDQRGAYIAAVAPGGPAEKAGVLGASQETEIDGRFLVIGGDVITMIDDQVVQSFDDLLIYIALNTEPGQEVLLTLLRDGSPQKIFIALGERPESVNVGQVP